MKTIKTDADVVVGNRKFKAICEFVGGSDGKVSMIVRIKDDEGALSSTSVLSLEKEDFIEMCDSLFDSEESKA